MHDRARCCPPVSNTIPPSAPRWYLVPTFLLGIHLLLRGWLLAGTWDRVDVEELRFGLLPHDLIAGLDAPLSAYQTMWREGGSLLMAPLQAPILWLGGGSYEALRASAIAWHGLLLLAAVAVLRKAAGPWAAAIGGLLVAVGTPYLARSQILAMANHGEAMLPVLGLVLVAEQHRIEPRRATAAGVGLLAGSCLAFAFSTLPAVALVLGLLAWGGGLSKRRLGIGAAGLLVGTWPWWSWLVYRTEGALEWRRLQSEGLLPVLLGVPANADMLSRSEPLQMAAALFHDHLPAFLGWQDGGGPRAAANTLPALVLSSLGLLGAIRLGSRVLADLSAPGSLAGAFLVLFIPLYLVATVLAGFPLSADTFDGYWYLLPLAVPLLLLAGTGLGGGTRGRRLGLLSGLSLAVWFVLALQLPRELPRTRPLAQLRGWSVLPLASRLENDTPPSEIARMIQSRPEDRVALVGLLGRAFAIHRLPRDPPPCAITNAPCPLVVEGYAQALGRAWADQAAIRPEVDGLLWSLRTDTDSELRRAALVGLGRAVAFHPPEERWLSEVIPRMEAVLAGEEEISWFHEGIGLEEPLGRDFHYARHWGGGAVPHHLAWAKGVGRGFARLLLERRAAATLHPPPGLAAQLSSTPGGLAAYQLGFDEERRRIRRYWQ